MSKSHKSICDRRPYLMKVMRFLFTADIASSFQVVSSGQYITKSFSEVEGLNAYNPDRSDGPRSDCDLSSL